MTTRRATSSPTNRTSIRLADDRELIYYDDEPGRVHTTVDARDLESNSRRPEIRRDPILDEWVIIATHRQERTHLPPAAECPLCPSRPGHLTEIPDLDYDVVVFENRFPSLRGSGGAPPPDGDLLERCDGVGRCEVLCYTSDHSADFASLPMERLKTLGRAWADRTRELSRVPGVEYVLCFENRGEEIGVTLAHPHGQIYAYPFVPPRIERAMASAARYRHTHGGCLFCDTVSAEIADGQRIVARTERCVAFVPFAARWPFEVRVYPIRHVADLADLSEDELAELIGLQADVMRRFNGLFESPPPYIMAWIGAPVGAARDLGHLHLEVSTVRRAEGKLKYLAGSETAAGAFINDILPEHAAERLRNVVVS